MKVCSGAQGRALKRITHSTSPAMLESSVLNEKYCHPQHEVEVHFSFDSDFTSIKALCINVGGLESKHR